MTAAATGKLALLWRGDREARRNATPQNNRFNRVFEALATIGIPAEPAVYADEMAAEVREQLLKLDGVLVWVDPISKGQRPDYARCDVAGRRVQGNLGQRRSRRDPQDGCEGSSSSHEASRLGHRHPSLSHRSAFREAFPPRLQSAGPRVLKQNRGNGGQGVWRVELIPSSQAPSGHRAIVRVLHAAGQRAGRHAARRFHETLRGLFRCRRLHRRSAVPIAAARGHDPLLYERRKGRRFRAPIRQGADSAATRRPGLGSCATGPAHHASCLGSPISSTPDEDGVGVDASNDASSGY